MSKTDRAPYILLYSGKNLGVFPLKKIRDVWVCRE